MRRRNEGRGGMKAHTRRPLFRAKGRTACQRFELRLPFQAFPNGVSAQPCSCISRRRFRPRWLPDASKMATSPRYCLQDIAFKMFALFYYVRLFLPSVLLPALFHYVRLFIPSPVSSPGHCSWMGWWGYAKHQELRCTLRGKTLECR